MADITSFLFQGDPVPPQPTGSDTSTSYPLWLQQYTYNLANAATNLAQTPFNPFPGPKNAAPSDATQQAWQMATGNVGNWAPFVGQAGALTTSASQPISGADISQFMNPYSDQVVGALQQASNRNLFSNILPNVQDRFVSAGQSRSPQEMYATNQAIYDSNQSLNQATASTLAQGYQGALAAAQQQKQQQQSAGAQMGQLGALNSQLSASDTGQVAAAGQAQDTVNQANINTAVADFNAQQNWPFLNLGFASNIIRGQPVPQTTQTASTQFNPGQTFSSSPLQSFIGSTMGASALGLKDGGAVSGALSRGRLHKFDGGLIDPFNLIAQIQALLPSSVGGVPVPNPANPMDQIDPLGLMGGFDVGKALNFARGGALRRYADGGKIDAPTPPRKPWDIGSHDAANFTRDPQERIAQRGRDAIAAALRTAPFRARPDGVDDALDAYAGADPAGYNDDSQEIARMKLRHELDDYYARGGRVGALQRRAA